MAWNVVLHFTQQATSKTEYQPQFRSLITYEGFALSAEG
jgi:hypothetical protein